MAGTLYSHASTSFCCPHRVKQWEVAEREHPSRPPLTAANLTLNAHLKINSCGFGEIQEEEEEATKL